MRSHLAAYRASPMGQVAETSFDEDGCLVIKLGCGSSLKMAPQRAEEIAIGLKVLQEISVVSNVRRN